MKPILYTFRRCPYAIRARLAIKISGVEVEAREVDLRNKPQAMLDCSPKGTVPVLQLAFLMGQHLSIADAAIIPFVRQFAHVDKSWFDAAYVGPLANWLDRLVRSPLFVSVMQKGGDT